MQNAKDKDKTFLSHKRETGQTATKETFMMVGVSLGHSGWKSR